jgi:hypothetical protein
MMAVVFLAGTSPKTLLRMILSGSPFLMAALLRREGGDLEQLVPKILHIDVHTAR